MKRIRINYREGTVVAIPVEGGGFAVGLVSRLSGDGRCFGHFFGPRRANVAGISLGEDFTPDKSILSGRFGDLWIISGKWSIVGQLKSWRREEWPLPLFMLKGDAGLPIATVSIYDDLDLKFVESYKVKSAELSGKFVLFDTMMGAGAVETRLKKLV